MTLRYGARARMTGRITDAMVSSWGHRAPTYRTIQTGSIDLNSLTSQTATLPTPVDVNNAIIVWLGTSNGGATLMGDSCARVTLTNSTTVTATCGLAYGVSWAVKFVVIEFFPGVIKTVQRSTVALNTAASATATITSVDTTKSTAFWLGSVSSDAVNNITSGYYPTVVLTNATTVTAATGVADGSAATYAIGFQVVEWY